MTDDPLAKYHILIEGGSLIIDVAGRSAIVKVPQRPAGMSDEHWAMAEWAMSSVETELKQLGYTVDRAM